MLQCSAYKRAHIWLSDGDRDSSLKMFSTLRQRDPQLHVVITGRDASEALIGYADLVTEMHEIKHPYKLQEVRAQKGIEF
jgi:cob(I)alamin adenosyltransferase